MILITSVDEYLGYCLTAHFSQTPSLCKNMRVLYQKKKGSVKSAAQSWIHCFSKKEIDVVPVDYMHPNDLSLAMRNIDQLILVAPSHANRVQQCQNICDMAVKSGVNSIIFLSHQGSQSDVYTALHDYGKIENHIVSSLPSSINWVILRLDWIQQYLHLWSTQVEVSRTLSLPLRSEVCPVDITDVCSAISMLVEKEGEFLTTLDDYYAAQVYTLTGPEAITSKSMLQMLSDATGFMHYRHQLVRLMDTQYYLRDLGRNIWFDARLKREQSIVYHNQDKNEYRTNVLFLPNDIQIQTFIDYFDWVNATSGSVPVEHLETVIKQKPRSVQDFFYENANSFKPKV